MSGGGRDLDLQAPVTSLKNIGGQRAAALGRLGIFTVEDLICHFPRMYEDRTQTKKVADMNTGESNALCAVVPKPPETVFVNGRQLTRLTLSDDTGRITLVWFNQPYMKNNLVAGKAYYFWGKVCCIGENPYRAEGRLHLRMESPEYEAVDALGLSSAGIIPIYPLARGLSQKVLRGFVKTALDAVLGEALTDWLPAGVRQRYSLPEKQWAIANIHFPQRDAAFFTAREKLVFDELFLMQLGLREIKERTRQAEADGGFVVDAAHQAEFTRLLPFALTTGQLKTLAEINRDLSSGGVMNRLVQGDVGSGKTAVAMVAAYGVVKTAQARGIIRQVAVMAPTEVLAQQHYREFTRYFAPLGVSVAVLAGGQKKRERDEVLAGIERGEIAVVVGTHAVIQETVHFNALALAVTDEQHRFGVRQRAMLAGKGEGTHVLVMSATPIPRTLALILYGDLDISIIDGLPPGRQPIETYAVNGGYRPRIYAFMEKELAMGRQAYVICPSIEENEETGADLKAVTRYVEEIRGARPQRRVEALHGKLKAEEKQRLMQSFAAHETDVLVSTTVIEVGVNVPNATLMLVENADRFGLPQLHQLRGRVGRGAYKSYCILISDSRGKATRERLKAMTKTADGFAIAELDLKLRGPGDFFGTMQHGLPELKIANLFQDTAILQKTQEAVEMIKRGEIKVTAEEEERLAQALAKLFRGYSL